MKQKFDNWSRSKYYRILKILKNDYDAKLGENYYSINMDDSTAEKFENKYGICFEYTDSESIPLFWLKYKK